MPASLSTVFRLSGLLFACLAFVLAGCGESSAEKAHAQVCSSRTEISKQVESLKSLTPLPTSLVAAKTSFEIILKELGKIQSEVPKLEGPSKSQVETATNTFKAQITSLALSLTKGFNPATAATQLQRGLEQLLSSYKQTIAQISC